MVPMHATLRKYLDSKLREYHTQYDSYHAEYDEMCKTHNFIGLFIERSLHFSHKLVSEVYRPLKAF